MLRSLVTEKVHIACRKMSVPPLQNSHSLSTLQFPSNPTFQEFRAFKNGLVESDIDSGAKHVRLDCMKPDTALSHYLLPQPLLNEPYAEKYDESQRKLISTWTDISALDANNIILSKGVRDGIFLSLKSLSSLCEEVILPSDVYPVYEKLINSALGSDMPKTLVDTLGSNNVIANIVAVNTSANAVLILPCPISPAGRSISDHEVQLMESWLRQNPHRRIILDCVYSYDLQRDCKTISRLLSMPQVVALFSLSKAWLSPFIETETFTVSGGAASITSITKGNSAIPRSNNSTGVGFVHSVDGEWLHHIQTFSLCEGQSDSTNSSMAPSHTACKLAHQLLSQQPRLPLVLQRRFDTQWKHLSSSIKPSFPLFVPPTTGYFTSLPVAWDKLYSNSGIIAVPGSVFGSPHKDLSVISCLYDIKDIDVNQTGDMYENDYGRVDAFAESACDTHKQVPVGSTGISTKNESPYYYVTTLSNFIKGYDKYSRVYSKDGIPESTFQHQFFLLQSNQLEVGLQKAKTLLNKLSLVGDKLLVLHTTIPIGSGPVLHHDTGEGDLQTGQQSDGDHHNSNQVSPDNVLYYHPKGQFVKRNWIHVSGLSILPYDLNNSTTGKLPTTSQDTRSVVVGLENILVEEAASLSLQLNNPALKPYTDLMPRSVSVLPVAKGCQAKCPFCFSKGSVSDDTKQKRLLDDNVERLFEQAKSRGSIRAVITGGGEPFMLPFDRLIKLIQQASIFPTVCLISNGYYLSQQLPDKRLNSLQDLDKAGLTVLSLSRHAATEEGNSRIMYLATECAKVAESWRQGLDNNLFANLKRLRWVCVLQKGGVENTADLMDYMDFAAASGAPEVCFKELYVSTSTESLFHDYASNKWSLQHQIPLSLVINFCEENGFLKVAELPWGAPVYEGMWKGSNIRVAAYTEPSVYWERVHGICRSWNIMADGAVYTSLEDTASALALDSTDTC